MDRFPTLRTTVTSSEREWPLLPSAEGDGTGVGDYPTLVPQQTQVVTIDNFGGINQDAKIALGEFSDMMNLRSEGGILKTRPRRMAADYSYVTTSDKTLYAACYDGGDVCELIDKYIYLNGEQVLYHGGPIGIEGMNAADIVPFGSYFVVFLRLRNVIAFSLVVYRVTKTISSIAATPYMDYVVACQNRIWGCRYGVDVNNNTVNEIYATKLGTAGNWNTFDGLASDSYTASVGAAGMFTGAAVQGNHPVFFKRDTILKVYISASGAHQIVEHRQPGVPNSNLLTTGGGRAVAQYKGRLIYPTTEGWVMDDGSTAVDISAKVKSSVLKENETSRACVVGNRLYIHGKHANDPFLVFDMDNGTWTKENALPGTMDGLYDAQGGPLIDLNVHDKLAAYTHEDGVGKKIAFLMAEDGFPGPGVDYGGTMIPWHIETGDIGYTDRGHKYIGRVNIRLNYFGKASFYVKYDDSQTWEQKMALPEYLSYGNPVRSYDVPIIPRRCDHFRLRISGEGLVCIYSIALVYEGGGELSTGTESPRLLKNFQDASSSETEVDPVDAEEQTAIP